MHPVTVRRERLRRLLLVALAPAVFLYLASATAEVEWGPFPIWRAIAADAVRNPVMLVLVGVVAVVAWRLVVWSNRPAAR